MTPEIKKQLKQASAAIDLVKMSQRSQHTSIKEAMRKILRCISMVEETKVDKIYDEPELITVDEPEVDQVKTAKEKLLAQANEIKEKQKIKAAEKIATAQKTNQETEEEEAANA